MSNADLFERSSRLIPGGVNSPVRAFRAVGGTPLFLQSASGAWVTDVEGRRFIDYVGSWGAMVVGHAHLDVVRASVDGFFVAMNVHVGIGKTAGDERSF